MSTRHIQTPAKLPLAAAAHVPFSFLHDSLKHNQDAQFVTIVMDFAKGLGLCLEMAASSTLARTMNEELPLLNPEDTDRLMRFATMSANLMARHAADRIDWMNKYLVKEGK